MSKFHERLNTLKNESNETQASIADKIGITPQAFSYIVKGREPSYDVLIKLAKYFNCTTDYLLGISAFKTVDEAKEMDKLYTKATRANAFIPTSNDSESFLEIELLLLVRIAAVCYRGELDVASSVKQLLIRMVNASHYLMKVLSANQTKSDVFKADKYINDLALAHQDISEFLVRCKTLFTIELSKVSSKFRDDPTFAELSDRYFASGYSQDELDPDFLENVGEYNDDEQLEQE